MNMVMTRAPLRVSFVGGGSDIPPGPGAVLSSAIDKHVYCVARRRLDDKVYLTWREKEVVEDASELKHDIAREALAEVGWKGGVELVFFADVPGVGSGLGSSAATCVALLHALLSLQGYTEGELDRRWIADLACNVAIDSLRKPQGRQDELICAVGGCLKIEFKGTSAEVESVLEQRLKPCQRKVLSDHFALYRGADGGRDANEVLRSFEDTKEFREECKSIVDRFEQLLAEDEFEMLADEVAAHHALKHQSFSKYAPGGADLVPGYWTQLPNGKRVELDLKFKLCGAGGTGHLLVGVTPRTHGAISRIMEKAWGPELPFRFVDYGSMVLYTE